MSLPSILENQTQPRHRPLGMARNLTPRPMEPRPLDRMEPANETPNVPRTVCTSIPRIAKNSCLAPTVDLTRWNARPVSTSARSSSSATSLTKPVVRWEIRRRPKCRRKWRKMRRTRWRAFGEERHTWREAAMQNERVDAGRRFKDLSFFFFSSYRR